MSIGIFLDRDGTINEEINFLTAPQELRLIPGAAEAIRRANALNLTTIIVTNQSGIARGLLTEEQLRGIHEHLLALLQAQGARIDGIYYCPHHPLEGEGRYRTTCDCRKPNIGMITRAAREHGIDTQKSFLIGDRLLDVETAHNAGLTPVLVLTGYGSKELDHMRERNIPVPYIAQDLLEAVQFVQQSILETHS